MKILGIDPGATTGWCLYDTAGFVVGSGTFPEAELDGDGGMPGWAWGDASVVVLERPRGQGPTRPQVVECGIVFGMLYSTLRHRRSGVHWIYRMDVRKALQDATQGTIRVVNDATAWAALVAIHGHDSDRKPKKRKGVVVDAGGPLGAVTSHGRAALATAVAWWLRSQAGEPSVAPPG